MSEIKKIIDKISPNGLDVSRGLKDTNNDISLIKLNVAASVTRSPFIYFERKLASFIFDLICGYTPWTITSLTPKFTNKLKSRKISADLSSAVISPSKTTTNVFPRNSLT